MTQPDTNTESPGRGPLFLPGADPEKAELRGTTQKASRIRTITAATTLESLRNTAQLTQIHEVDMTRIAALRQATKKSFQEQHGVNLTYLPFFASAIVDALLAHPNINASYDPDAHEITYHPQVNLGIAVDTPAGLMTPVIHNAENMTVSELAKAIVDLADRARTRKLKPSDLTGGTFTITNIGSEGALSDTPILVPPQAAILGIGAIKKRPVVVTQEGVDTVVIRSIVNLSMTYDHQLIDGADAGRFLTSLGYLLENADYDSELGN